MIVERHIVPYAGRQAVKPTLGDITTIPPAPALVPGINQNTLLLIAAVVLGGAALLWLGRKYGGESGGDMPAPRHKRKSHSVKLTDALLWAGGAAAIAYFAGKSNSL